MPFSYIYRASPRLPYSSYRLPEFCFHGHILERVTMKFGDNLPAADCTADRETKKKILYRCLITAGVSGVLAHAFMLFSKISFHDDLRHTFDFGATYTSGRWALGILESLMKKLFGLNAGLPVFSGFLSLFFIALSAYLIILRFRIRRVPDQVLITALMICFPVVTATFSYMFTAPAYFFALLCATAGAYLITGCFHVCPDGRAASENAHASDRMPLFLRVMGGLLLLAFSTGIYQAYLASGVCFLYFYLFTRILDENTDSKRWILSCLAALFAVGAGLILYLGFNRLALRLTGLQMGSYQGLDSMTRFGLPEIARGVYYCYHSVAKVFLKGYKGLFYLNSSRTALIILWIMTGLEMIILVCIRKKTCLQRILIFAMLALCPLPLALVELMVANSGDGSTVHTLMVYSLVYLFVFPAALLQQAETIPRKKIAQWIKRTEICCLLFLAIYFAFFDNAAYFKARVYQEQSEQFLNRLVMRIESEEGYEPDMKIALVGTFDPDIYTHYEELDQIEITYCQDNT